MSKRIDQLKNAKSAQHPEMLSGDELSSMEEAHPEGLSVQQIVDLLAERGEHLTEATFRKYVQMGLLPRSRRVGRKGRERGSRGLYPSTIVRQLLYIWKFMGQGFTMDEIQRNFLFVRGDIQALERQLDRVFGALGSALSAADPVAKQQFHEVKEAGVSLLQSIEQLERRITLQARMARAVI